MTQVLAFSHLHTAAIWIISIVSIALVLARPKGLPEALWATIGALLLVLGRLISPLSAAHAAGKGLDVYLFLTGMMIMSELARLEGVFDWVAAHAVEASKGSPSRLFVLVYSLGVVVTVFLSNDATAVVLTPAVLAAVRAAEVEPLPYLLICAFVANAASFVLPISNPANLVVYSGGLPLLGRWLITFGLPSVASIVVTFLLLRWLASRLLRGKVKTEVSRQPLAASGKLTVYGVAFLAVTLMVASALGADLGAPACVAAVLVAACVSAREHKIPKDIIKGIAWSVLPLVAGLFVIVEAINSAGALGASVHALQVLKSWPTLSGAFTSGFGVAVFFHLLYKHTRGLIAGAAVKAAEATGALRNALLIGIDLGPNLSVTGSLATILWLIALRREGQNVGFWKFLRWGVVVMPPALALAILALLINP